MNRRVFVSSVTSLALGSRGAPPSATEPRVRCRAFLERAALPYDGEICLTALLESMQEGCEVFVPLTWGFRGFGVAIIGAEGVQTLPPINNFHPPSPEELSDPESFVRMYKGMLVGETLRQPVRDFFPKRGVFTIAVSYLSPVPKAYTSVAKALVQEDGSFESPRLSVTVT